MMSTDGVKVDRYKTKAMLNWPLPTNIKGLRGSLSLMGY